jgi:hypothetical protein
MAAAVLPGAGIPAGGGRPANVHNRVVRKPQFPDKFRLKTTKNVDCIKKSAFFGRLVREPTGFLNKSNML